MRQRLIGEKDGAYQATCNGMNCSKTPIMHGRPKMVWLVGGLSLVTATVFFCPLQAIGVIISVLLQSMHTASLLTIMHIT